MEYKFGNKIVKMRVYQKNCNAKHFMVKYQGFGISETELEKLKLDKVDLIHIIYTGVKGIEDYIVTLNQYHNSNKEWAFNDGDKQKFVSKNDMLKA